MVSIIIINLPVPWFPICKLSPSTFWLLFPHGALPKEVSLGDELFRCCHLLPWPACKGPWEEDKVLMLWRVYFYLQSRLLLILCSCHCCRNYRPAGCTHTTMYAPLWWPEADVPDVIPAHRASLSHALRSRTLPLLEIYTFWCQVYGL